MIYRKDKWLCLLNRARADLGTAPTVLSEDFTYYFDPEPTVSCNPWEVRYSPPVDQPPETTQRAISELRRISGLTWQQLGQLFEVSRRSVHFWASGKPQKAENEARLTNVLDVVRYADRGDAGSTRRALLNADGGPSPFDLLVALQFEKARTALGRGPRRTAPGSCGTKLGSQGLPQTSSARKSVRREARLRACRTWTRTRR